MTLAPSFRAEIAAVARALVERMRERAAVKTLEQYTRQLRQYAREYYTGKLDDNGFLDRMISAVENQIERAWREGMRVNGMGPEDIDEDMRAQIEEIIRNEQDHITNLADLINDQRSKDAGLDAINARCDTWANRYTDVVNQAKLASSEANQRYEWIYGDVSVHCETCLKLNGTVLTAQEWENGPYHPQQPPNPNLSCSGWRCRCKLVKTKKKRTGLPAGL